MRLAGGVKVRRCAQGPPRGLARQRMGLVDGAPAADQPDEDLRQQPIVTGVLVLRLAAIRWRISLPILEPK